MYQSIHENKRAQRRANRNIIFLILFACGMIWAGAELLELREERRAAEDTRVTLSGSMATTVTRHLCVEINSEDYLVVCQE